MTDNNAWQSPSGSPAPAPQPFGGAAPPPPEVVTPSSSTLPPPSAFPPPPPPVFANGFTPPVVGPAQTNWTPPPKPGLIPLRPLGFGTLLGASFQVMRRNPKPTLGLALLLYGGVGLLLAAIITIATIFTFNRIQSASPDEVDAITAGVIGASALALLIPVGLSLVIAAILQGLVSLEVARATLGEKLSAKQLWRLAKGRWGALIGWSVLITVAVLVAYILFIVVFTALAVLGGVGGIIAALLLGFVASLGGAALYAWIGTRLALVPTVLMLERLSLRNAMARSWSLTQGYFWKTLGILLLVNFIVQAAAQIVVTPISFVAGLGGSLFNPNGTEEAALVTMGVAYLAAAVVSIIFGAIALVIISSVTALLYIDIRMRKEGLDIELTRFVEARQAGESGVENPYERLDPLAPGYFEPVASTNRSRFSRTDG